MLTILSDGFAKDLITIFVVTVLVGSLLAFGGAWAVDTYFGDTAANLVGEMGQYDAVIHIRQEAKEAAIPEFERILRDSLPGAQWKEGITIAGKMNLFLRLPDALYTAESFQNLSSYFSGVSGFSGVSIVAEPSIVISGVQQGVRQELIGRINSLDNVRCVFNRGSDIYVLLEAADTSGRLRAEINEMLESYQLVEFRLPLDTDPQDIAPLSAELERQIATKLRPEVLKNISSGEDEQSVQAFRKVLHEMKGFLLTYASKVDISLSESVAVRPGERLVVTDAKAGDLVIEVLQVGERTATGLIVSGDASTLDTSLENRPIHRLSGKDQVGEQVGTVTISNERYRLAQTIDNSVELLQELEGLAKDADAAVTNAEQTLETFQRALVELGQLQQQLAQLSQSPSGAPQGTELLLTLLLNNLFKDALGAGDDPVGSFKDLDVAALQDTLESISTRIDAISTIDLEQIVEQIQFVKDSLPQLSDEDIGQSVELIDQYLGGEVIPGSKIEFLLDGDIALSVLEQALAEVEGFEHIDLYSLPVGVIMPSALSVLFNVLSEVRGIIAGLLSIVFVALVFLLDHATLLSASRRLLLNTCQGKHRRIKTMFPVVVFGALLGACLLSAIYWLSGGNVPYLNAYWVLGIGALLGTTIALLAERISPVNQEELLAAEALGLTYAQIMREVVIPAGRPGIVQTLNRRRQQC